VQESEDVIMMEKWKITITAFLAVAAAMSCNTATVKRPYTFNDAYKGVNLSGRKIIVVFPGDDRIVINNKDDVIDDFGGVNAKPESRIRKFYFPEFYTTFKSFVSGDSVFSFDSSVSGAAGDTLGKKEIELRMGMDTTPRHYAIPEKSSLQGIGLDSAIFVILNRIEFKRNNFHIEYYWDDKTRKQANLEVGCALIVWDYKNDAPVFYGTLTEQTEFRFTMQRKHWDESARDLAKIIIKTVRCL
jgi:hypothetical protein